MCNTETFAAAMCGRDGLLLTHQAADLACVHGLHADLTQIHAAHLGYLHEAQVHLTQVLWSLPPNFWTQAWPRPHRILYVSKLMGPHELAILQGSKEHQLLALRPGRKLLPAASHAWQSFWYLGSLRFRH